ncbi:uncharacterized protein LOC120827905 [Gasterosteus aculeatus]
MQMMGFSCDVTTLRVSRWVSILGLIAVSRGLELKTIPHVVATCGENLTLPCEVSASDQLNIISFSWLAKNESMCPHEHGRPDSGAACESATQDHKLTLTLYDVMPVHQGKYFCKVRANHGAKSSTTMVTVQDCMGTPGSSMNESHAQCWFSGVYPIGSISWSQGGLPLTQPASTREEMDPRGRYTVSSTIEARKGESNEPYKCSLWIPSAGKELSSQELPWVGKQRSSGSAVHLAWACAAVAMMKSVI